MIDITKCPTEDYVDVYNPNGTVLVRTNDEVMFSYIRHEIAKNRYEGYYVVFHDKKSMINHYGVVEDWDKDMFKWNSHFSGEILRYGLQTRHEEREVLNNFKSYSEYIESLDKNSEKYKYALKWENKNYKVDFRSIINHIELKFRIRNG